MRIVKTLVTAGLIAAGLSLAGCYNDHPGRWGDHHHHRGDRDGDGHHHDHDGDHDHDEYNNGY
ncbi:MAG: hypothetical protein ACTHMG_12760 [Sphingomonas sp.]